MSLYSVIKPPRFGNCSVSNVSTTDFKTTKSISLKELNYIYSKRNKASEVEKLSKKIKEAVVSEDWNIDSSSEHNYAQWSVIEYAAFYVAQNVGTSVSFAIEKWNCNICRNALFEPGFYFNPTEEFLLFSGSKDIEEFTAKKKFVSFIEYLENLFQCHMYSRFPYEDILSEIDCTDWLRTIIQTYVMLRMRQCCRNVNGEKKKCGILKKNGQLVWILNYYFYVKMTWPNKKNWIL